MKKDIIRVALRFAFAAVLLLATASMTLAGPLGLFGKSKGGCSGGACANGQCGAGQGSSCTCAPGTCSQGGTCRQGECGMNGCGLTAGWSADPADVSKDFGFWQNGKLVCRYFSDIGQYALYTGDGKSGKYGECSKTPPFGVPALTSCPGGVCRPR